MWYVYIICIEESPPVVRALLGMTCSWELICVVCIFGMRINGKFLQIFKFTLFGNLRLLRDPHRASIDGSKTWQGFPISFKSHISNFNSVTCSMTES